MILKVFSNLDDSLILSLPLSLSVYICNFNFHTLQEGKASLDEKGEKVILIFLINLLFLKGLLKGSLIFVTL